MEEEKGPESPACWCCVILRSAALPVFSPEIGSLSAWPYVKYLSTSSETASEAGTLPVCFFEGATECLTSPRSHRNWEDDQQIEPKSSQAEFCATEWSLSLAHAPLSALFYFTLGHVLSPPSVRSLTYVKTKSSRCSVSGHEKWGQGFVSLVV